jgi:uncharacterized protein (TIGR03000 family)
MYSVVLLAALSGGVEMPECHRHGGRHHGGCSSGSCHSGGCGSSYAGGCSSCGGGVRYASVGGCSSCGGVRYASVGGCASGTCSVGGGCPGGVCSLTGDGLAPVAYVLGEVAAPATIVVNLPADAKLLIDDNATTSTTDRRVFVSPDLKPGKEYHYTLKAEVVRDGKAVTMEEKIIVKAGEETKVSLTVPATGVAKR